MKAQQVYWDESQVQHCSKFYAFLFATPSNDIQATIFSAAGYWSRCGHQLKSDIEVNIAQQIA